MLSIEKKREIQAALKVLVRLHSEVEAQIESTVMLLNQVLELEAKLDASAFNWPVVDESKFAILWNGKECFVGNGLPFRLFCRLLQSPNSYVSQLSLADDVWNDDQTSSTAIRGVVKRLRDHLTLAKMKDLSEMIQSITGHYGLMVL